MIEFILNDTLIRTDKPPGMSLLDFIRYEMGLTGTKTGCREGDCGACMVMEGELQENDLVYKAVVSCLTPIGKVDGKHIVSIEGLNCRELSPTQQAIIQNSATQCGFCTPGIIVSLTAFILSGDYSRPENFLAALDGNICRCTGYKSIEKAVKSIHEILPADNSNILVWMVSKGYLPEYFTGIFDRLFSLSIHDHPINNKGLIIGGGTDLMVRKADEITESSLNLLQGYNSFHQITAINGQCSIGGGVTVSRLMNSPVMNDSFPKLREYFSLISSTPVRNMATIAGNIINASPIADLVIFFLALDAIIILESREGRLREIPLKLFYRGYKVLDRDENELIREIRFYLPQANDHFNFEKVSKRQYLDIATVNTAILICLKDKVVERIHLSAGGVSPVPLYLSETCRFLTGKVLDVSNLKQAIRIMENEIAPISDIRGTKGYKQLLLRQLILAHFHGLFPEIIGMKEVSQVIESHEKQ